MLRGLPKEPRGAPRLGLPLAQVGQELQDIPEPLARRQEQTLRVVGMEKQIPQHPHGSFISCFHNSECLGTNSSVLKLKK